MRGCAEHNFYFLNFLSCTTLNRSTAFQRGFGAKYLFVGKGQSQGCAGTGVGTGCASASNMLILEFQIILSCEKMK